MTGIHLSYRLGPSDVVRALEFHRRRPGVLNMMSWGFTAAVLAVLLQREEGPEWMVWTLLILAVVLAVAAVAWPTVDAWWLHRRRRIFAPTEVRLGDDGLELRVGSTREVLPWSRFVRYATLSQLFMLYWSEAEFVVVPKRAFTSVAEIGAFEGALRARLGPPCPGSTRKER